MNARIRNPLNAVSASNSVLDRPLRAGDHVRLRRGGAVGEIESVDKGKAQVLLGGLRMSVNLKDLESVRAPVRVQRAPGVRKHLRPQEGGFNRELDVRGFRREEVLNLVQDFVDRAMINSVKDARIVHGKGNGTLRRAVAEKLREFPQVESYHPAPNQGGDGVTVVEF